jgi:hypothetical protein
MTHRARHQRRGGEQPIEVDPGCHAQVVEEVDEVLGGKVAAGAGRER